MFTRKQLMRVPKEYGLLAHQTYFEELVNANGGFKAFSIPFSIEEVKEALESGDIYLNTLPLEKWDRAQVFMRVSRKTLDDRSENRSMATLNCMLKAAARLRYESIKFMDDHLQIVHVS